MGGGTGSRLSFVDFVVTNVKVERVIRNSGTRTTIAGFPSTGGTQCTGCSFIFGAQVV